MFLRVSIYTFCLLSCEVISLRDPSPSRMVIWFFLYSFLRFSSSDLMYLLSLSTSLQSYSTRNFNLFFSLSSLSFSRMRRLSLFWKLRSIVLMLSNIFYRSFRSLSLSSSQPFLSSLNLLSIAFSSSQNFILVSCSSSYNFFSSAFLTSLEVVNLAICWVMKVMLFWQSAVWFSFSTSILWKLSWRFLSYPVLRSPDSFILSRRLVILCYLSLILSLSSCTFRSWSFLSSSRILSFYLRQPSSSALSARKLSITSLQRAYSSLRSAAWISVSFSLKLQSSSSPNFSTSQTFSLSLAISACRSLRSLPWSLACLLISASNLVISSFLIAMISLSPLSSMLKTSP